MQDLSPAAVEFASKRAAAPMKETAEDKAVKDAAYSSTGAQVRAFVERYERLDSEKAEIAEAQREVMAEAKGQGFNTTVLRKLVAMRKRDRDQLDEEEAILEMYRVHVGL